jgi:hypothetical protein
VPISLTKRPTSTALRAIGKPAAILLHWPGETALWRFASAPAATCSHRAEVGIRTSRKIPSRLFWVPIQSVDGALQLFQLLSSLAELALRRQADAGGIRLWQESCRNTPRQTRLQVTNSASARGFDEGHHAGVAGGERPALGEPDCRLISDSCLGMKG